MMQNKGRISINAIVEYKKVLSIFIILILKDDRRNQTPLKIFQIQFNVKSKMHGIAKYLLFNNNSV